MVPGDDTPVTGRLAALMGLTEAEISSRKKLLEFGDEDVERLLSIRDLAQGYADPVIENFYAYLLSLEGTAAFFESPQAIERIKQKQKEYFLQLTAGDYGEAYVENRLWVGAVHERIGLPPSLYLAMCSFYLWTVVAWLREDFKDDPDRTFGPLHSMAKLLFFDASLAIDSYIFARDSQLEKQVRKLQEQATVIDAADDSIVTVVSTGRFSAGTAAPSGCTGTRLRRSSGCPSRSRRPRRTSRACKTCSIRWAAARASARASWSFDARTEASSMSR